MPLSELFTRLFGRKQELTRQTIAELPDEKLIRRVISLLPHRDASNASQRGLVYMAMLDEEVYNGGFNQYFHNTRGENAAEAAAAFERANAPDLADLVRRAHACFDGCREERERQWDGTVSGYRQSCENDPFDPFDKAYYALTKGDRSARVLADFIRNHADDFVAVE